MSRPLGWIDTSPMCSFGILFLTPHGFHPCWDCFDICLSYWTLNALGDWIVCILFLELSPREKWCLNYHCTSVFFFNLEDISNAIIDFLYMSQNEIYCSIHTSVAIKLQGLKRMLSSLKTYGVITAQWWMETNICF